MPLFLFERLAAADPAGPWRQIALDIPRMIEQSARHGYVMDWVNYIPGDGFYPAPPMQTGNRDSEQSGGSYDAIRVYLWAGMMHPSAAGRQALLQNLSGMEAYLREHPIPPERVAPSGAVIDANAPAGFSAAVIPLLAACQEKQALAQQRARLEQSRNPLTGLYGPGQRYYDQVLTLFSEGWSGGFFSFDPNGQLSVRWKKP
jgi:endoglucanase